MTNYDSLKVEELETQCRLLAEAFGELETEDYLDEIEDVETFCYISSTVAHRIYVNYNYDINNFDVYIASTHNDIKLEERIMLNSLTETYERLRKAYIELGNQYNLIQAD